MGIESSADAAGKAPVWPKENPVWRLGTHIFEVVDPEIGQIRCGNLLVNQCPVLWAHLSDRLGTRRSDNLKL